MLEVKLFIELSKGLFEKRSEENDYEASCIATIIRLLRRTRVHQVILFSIVVNSLHEIACPLFHHFDIGLFVFFLKKNC